MCRGNRGSRVFKDDRAVDLWLETLGEACERSGMLVHAYCVMNTHYHLLLETPRGNLVEGMKWLQGTFTQRYNALHRQWGHLFQGRYKAKIVDIDPAYFRAAAMYVLLNPVDAGLMDVRTRELIDYSWSSFPAVVGAPSKRPDWLVVQRLLSSCGIDQDSISGRRAFSALVKNRALSLQMKKLSRAEAEEWRMMERGWVHGCREFRKEMLCLLEEQASASGLEDHQQKYEVAELNAQRVLVKGLSVLGLKQENLAEMKKGDKRKLLLAGWLRAHCPVSAKWCSQTLNLGHPSTNTRAMNLYLNPPSDLKNKK